MYDMYGDFDKFILNNSHGNLRGPPMPPPQEIAGLIKGLLSILIRPY